MTVALDSNIVIYLIEANPHWAPLVTARLTAIRAAGDEIAFCDAGRLECLIKPIASGNATDVATYQSFFRSPRVKMLAVTAGTWERAVQISADFKLKPLDSVHLAAAIEHGCGLFFTNDVSLSRCTAIPVEVLS
jgi:predicted nucleic acid-binding protein